MSNRSAPQFDIYPELDRHFDQTTAFRLEPDELDQVIHDGLIDRPQIDEVPEHIKDWAFPRINSVLTTWYLYGEVFSDGPVSPANNPAPASIDALDAAHPNLAGCLQNLYSSLLAINTEPNAEGNLLGGDFELVLVPWQQFQNHHQTDFLGFIRQLRERQGLAKPDYMDPKLVEAIEGGWLKYRNPQKQEESDAPPELLSTKEYLDMKIRQDGPWGVMLMQASYTPGTQRFDTRSPDYLTNEGRRPLELNGVRVDAMGIFEYLALSLQFDPKHFSKTSSKNPGTLSWLLANRLDRGHEWNVPYAYFDSKPTWKLASASKAKSNRRPRLAVAG